ncbi:hypothetical protein RRG08_020686 [Elysia crispata]|uniref:EF-hand domain-containing protein n=1 Tax=Elysia crispata TaxID=231223 RepID=A0AAE0Z468_9GAST|nr:hypothetical protein RRG08_020686 [Elysia crispata]
MSAEHIGSEVREEAGGEKKGGSTSSSSDKVQSSRNREDLSSAKSILPPLRETSRARQGTLLNGGNSLSLREGSEGGGGGGGDAVQVSTTRENTKTEVQSLGLGRKTATLYLSRTHTMMKGRSSSQAVQKPLGQGEGMTSSRCTHRKTTNMSHQRGSGSGATSGQGHMSAEAEEELLSLVGLDAAQREFTFTGYTIEEDIIPREETPPDLTEDERASRSYRDVYLKTCQKLGVLPVAPVTRALSEDNVTLKTRGLGVRGARAIAAALVGNKHVKSLELEDNWIGGEGAVALASMLVGNNVITEINIADNRIGTKGIRAICEALCLNRTVRKIDVSGSNLFDHDAKYLADLLESNYCLQELRARNNKFGELGGLYLGPAIANNETLQILNLSWNHLRGKGAFAIAVGLGANLALKMMDLSWNGFCAKACKLLGQSLKENGSLRELDLSNNRVEAEGVGGLMLGVQVNITMTAIRLGSNPITPDVATVILRAITEHTESGIIELDLANIVIEEEFTRLLEDVRKDRLLLVKHGPVIKKGASVVKEGDAISGFMDPVLALYDYMSQKGYRVIDLFKRFDKDQSMTLTRDEFYTGLVQAHVPMTVGQLEELMEKLDKNRDGIVDLKALAEMMGQFVVKTSKKHCYTM